MCPLRPILHPLFALCLFLFYTACGGGGGGTPASDTTSEAVSAAALDDTVTDETLLADDFLDDLAADGAVYAASVSAASVAGGAVADEVVAMAAEGEAVEPVAWGRRRIDPPERTIIIDQQGDVAHVTVATQITGELWVDTTDDGVRNPGSKPFAHTLHRSATYQRSGGGWHLTAISPTDMPLADTTRQNVHIERVTASHAAGVIAEITDPTLELAVDDLPTLRVGDTIVVSAQVAHDPGSEWTPDTFVYLHHDGRRDRMLDDGLNGDEHAGDGIYSHLYTLSNQVGRHFAVVDALDSATLQNETDDDYAAHGWGIPYRVAGGTTGGDEAEVRALVESEGWLRPLTPMDRLNVAGGETSSGDTALLPEHWGRRQAGEHTRTVTVEIAGGVADVTIHTRWLGRLYVDTSFDDHLNPGVKPTDETAVHHLRYVKVGGSWRLDALSLGAIDLTEAANQTVAITAITLQRGQGTPYEITDPQEFYPVGDGLFTVAVGEQVTVTATVENTTTSGLTPPTFLFLHAGHDRQRMVDDGTHGDALAGDGVFTAVFTVGPARGHQRLVVDGLDSLTLQNEFDNDYNANRWVAPYRVARPSVVDHLPFKPHHGKNH